MNTNKPIVYIDIDGVLADFHAEYCITAGVHYPHHRDIKFPKDDPIRQKMIGSDFYSRLPKYPSADELIDIIVNQFGVYSILSSPLNDDYENSSKHKRIWIRRELSVQPENIIIADNKDLYAMKDAIPNILIDDRSKNLQAWKRAGGLGIQYHAADNAPADVKETLEQILSK